MGKVLLSQVHRRYEQALLVERDGFGRFPEVVELSFWQASPGIEAPPVHLLDHVLLALQRLVKDGREVANALGRVGVGAAGARFPERLGDLQSEVVLPRRVAAV